MTGPDEGTAPSRSLVRKVLTILGLTAAALAAGLLVWEAFFLVLLVFAGLLFAVFLDALAGRLAGWTGLGRRWAVPVVLLAFLGLVAGAVLWMGPPLVSQLTSLFRQIPSAVTELEGWLRDRGWGDFVLSQIPSADDLQQRSSEVLGRITGVFSTTLGVLANVLIVVFLGFYLALDRELYRSGVVRLFHRERRDRVRQVLDRLGAALRLWLLGRLASMAVVAVLTAIGLAILGLPLVLALSVLAGVLSFVPYVGPIVSAAPALAVAWLEAPSLALWVGLVYVLVQLVESYVVTPMIQKKVVALAPALLITAQILLGMAGGLTGILLATPMAVVVVVLVQMLYVEDVLDDDVEVLGA